MNINAQKITEEGSCDLGKKLKGDQLLSITDVAEILSVTAITASRIMKDTGHSIQLRRKVYIFESELFAFLRKCEVRHGK